MYSVRIKGDAKMAEDKTKKTKDVKKVEEVKIPKPVKPAAKKRAAGKKKTEAQKAIDNLTKDATKIEAKKERDMNEMVSVISITNSPLVYVSKSQQGYRVDWGGFLEENWMEYKELLNMRGAQRAFFEQPWIICEWDVLEDLRVTQHYENMIDLAGLDELFKRKPQDLEDALTSVPKGIRDLIIDRAFELMREGKLDSINTVNTIERVYNIDLTV